MQEIRFSVKMKVKTMYRFLIHHGYAGMSGVINFVISGGALALLVAGVGESTASKAALAIVAALFTVINPLYLYYKAAKQVKLTPMFAKPLDYTVSSGGLTVAQGEEMLTVAWDELRRVVETGKDFYIYLSLTRAYIFPKEDLSGQEAALRAAVKEYTKPEICKCKFKG
ncbi:MAG: YcxB family protein [Lachnospiraceae bacterium]|nr:YcxB family protein [Lachnospiraceae bacterium]